MLRRVLNQLPEPIERLIARRGWRITPACRAVLSAASFHSQVKLDDRDTLTSTGFLIASLDLGWNFRGEDLYAPDSRGRNELDLLSLFDESLGVHTYRTDNTPRNRLLKEFYDCIQIEQDDYEYPSLFYLSDNATVHNNVEMSPNLVSIFDSIAHASGNMAISAVAVTLHIVSRKSDRAPRRLERAGFKPAQLASDWRRLASRSGLKLRPTVNAVEGDIFEGGADLTMLPCSVRPSYSRSTQRWIRHFNLPTPGKRMQISAITELFKFSGSLSITKFVAYGASVSDSPTSPEAIEELGRNIGKITRRNSGVRIVDAVLFGTSGGRLGDITAAQALARGFRKTGASKAELRVFVHGSDRFDTVRRAIKSTYELLETDTTTILRSQIDEMQPRSATAPFVRRAVKSTPKEVDAKPSLSPLVEAIPPQESVAPWFLDLPLDFTNDQTLVAERLLISGLQNTLAARNFADNVGLNTAALSDSVPLQYLVRDMLKQASVSGRLTQLIAEIFKDPNLGGIHDKFEPLIRGYEAEVTAAGERLRMQIGSRPKR